MRSHPGYVEVLEEVKPVVEIKIFKSKPRSIMDFVDSVMQNYKVKYPNKILVL